MGQSKTRQSVLPLLLLGIATGFLLQTVLSWLVRVLVSYQFDPDVEWVDDLGWMVGPDGPRPAGISGVDAVFIMRTVVTLCVMACALWVIVSKRYPPSDRKWAYGAIGAILAFWLAAGAL
jgi:hypothetical protein